MSTIQKHEVGTIDWLDLTTPDLDGSRAFYAQLLGWHLVPYETSHGLYLTAEVGGRDAAGMMQMDRTIGDMPLPASWNVMIRVAHLESAIGDATALGGHVIRAPFEIAEIGRMAVMSDPTGAVFTLAHTHADFGIGVRGEPGAVTWCEVMTRNPAAAREFYTAMFAWAAETDPTSGYTTLRRGDESIGGILEMPSEVPAEAPSFWMPYFAVSSVDHAAATARELGGTVLAGAMDLPMGRFAVLEDPHGAPFGVLESRP